MGTHHKLRHNIKGTRGRPVSGNTVFLFPGHSLERRLLCRFLNIFTLKWYRKVGRVGTGGASWD